MERGRGRKYPELSHPFRNEFQRDRDRVVHARAFRRLENKTQVFTPGLSDHFRNRLTHTIEVSQIARTMARVLGLDEDLTEALALAHDVGHPPFGHAGEMELDRLMQQFGERFNHNLHALRIVESFENPYPRFPGLNLTFEVREGMAKHSTDRVPAEYLPELRPPVEAQLIDLCDEIAYNTSDLDDGYEAGLIAFDEARAAVEKFADLDETASQQYPAATERLRMQEIVRGLINWFVAGLLEGTVAAASGLKDVEAVRHCERRVVALSAEQAAGTAQLKELLRARVYNSEALAEARAASVSRISRLFETYMADPGLLPADYREESSGEPLHRQVCDYIAGMTDRFLVRTCRGLGIG